MHENTISSLILDICFAVHRQLGPGLFESVYEEILFYELQNKSLTTQRQHPIPVIWDNVEMGIGFKADLVVSNKVIVEIKSVQQIEDVHKKQLLTYLKISKLKLGLLINFNESLLKNGITRIVNQL